MGCFIIMMYSLLFIAIKINFYCGKNLKKYLKVV